MAKKESFLSKLRGESSNLNEEQELRKELLNLKISLSSGQLKDCLLYTSDAADE